MDIGMGPGSLRDLRDAKSAERKIKKHDIYESIKYFFHYMPVLWLEEGILQEFYFLIGRPNTDPARRIKVLMRAMFSICETEIRDSLEKSVLTSRAFLEDQMPGFRDQ
ncbi:hypothetical protein AVEN_47291-1 [Araneus ventricosus]|uniref:Uncharacterized protein n=1 Tax=Araneus ventricosus TaxID=182803 RepID=A0A4Y2UZD4_ARAVE|nr:hypothetical protein AVEN_47291-1 [Araneus ventricosus]